MDTTANRINEGMRIRGIKQSELSQKTGISKGALSSYASGKYAPKQTNIYLVSKALDVNEAWLMGHDVPIGRNVDLPDNAQQVEFKKRIPVLGRVAAGMPIAAIQNIEYYENVEDERIDYALHVKGDSMIGARICDGDTVYVTKDTDYENGDIVIALINGDDATVKRFYKYPDEIILRPENPTMKERHFKPGEVQLLGKVIEIKIKL